MSGYRVNAGFGKLPRTSQDSVGRIPDQYAVYSSDPTESQINQLTHRFGAGIDMSINRTRNNNYLQDIGYREFTTATSGMYDLDFTINGAFVPEMCGWLEYLMMSNPLFITTGSTVIDLMGVAVQDQNVVANKSYYVVPDATTASTLPTTGVKMGDVCKYTGNTTDALVKNNYYICTQIQPDVQNQGQKVAKWEPLNGFTSDAGNLNYFNTPILGKDYLYYKTKTAGQTNTDDMSTVDVGSVVLYIGATDADYTANHYYRGVTIKNSSGVEEDVWKDIGIEYNGEDMTFAVYSYINLDGPKYFDMGYQQINQNTTNGGLNELGLLVGCVIDSASINYESGSDAQVKFTINGVALNEYIYTTSEFIDYNAILDYEVPLQPLVAGCVCVEDDGEYVPIAQTDSAGITVSNNTSKLGNCLRLTYSSVALGALGIEMNISTYSNDPNKFMAHMYGYKEMGDRLVPYYEITKQPYGIDRMRIRSNNASSIMKEGTQTLDMNLTKVFVGSANRSYNVDNAIMDEPDLRPRKVQFVVGFIPPSI